LLAAGGLSADEAPKGSKSFPRQVLIIRHAEKPPDEAGSVHLSKQGKKRAQALPDLFVASATRPMPFPRPDFLFAAHHSGKSQRPVETVEAVARKHKLTIDDRFHSKDGTDKGSGVIELRREILGKKKYRGKTILICWRHSGIPELAGQLGATGYPKTWDGKVFDRVWQISYDEKGNTTFANLPQRLLPEDAAK
jgi:hypothetical protein